MSASCFLSISSATRARPSVSDSRLPAGVSPLRASRSVRPVASYGRARTLARSRGSRLERLDRAEQLPPIGEHPFRRTSALELRPQSQRLGHLALVRAAEDLRPF